MSDSEKALNKDLILREKLALQRTIMANQTTFLSFLRTSMYFVVAGLTLAGFLKGESVLAFATLFFVIAGVILVLGIVNFVVHRRSIEKSRIHIGNYRMEYLDRE